MNLTDVNRNAHPGAIRKLPVEHRIHLHGALIETTILPSCTNCAFCLPKASNVRAVDAYCDKYKAFPPLEVLIVGCAAWEEEIPF